MANSYKVINTDEWVRKTTFTWFKKFSNPTYCFNVKIDVEDIVNYSKETGASFFINFLYIISRVNNELVPFRLRYIDDQVRLYDRIDATFTVKTTDGSFNNAGVSYTSDYEEFYHLTKEEINKRNGKTDNSQEYNRWGYDVFYSSCVISIDLEAISQPLDTNNKNSLNVPRIFWDKYRLENGKYIMLLSMTVSHVLVDGEQLSSALNLVRKYCSNFKEIINKR